MATLFLIKLVLVGVQSVAVFGWADHDDRLFVQLASHISAGHWLGPYDRLTLAKGPAYPIWIALLHHLQVPLLLGQHVLYGVACWMVVHALAPLRVSPTTRVALFALLLLNPATFGQAPQRVIRAGIYPSLTLLVVAGAVGLHLRRAAGSLRRLWRWSAGLGLACGAFWLTREEGIWLVPALTMLIGATALALWKSNLPDRRQRLLLSQAWAPVFFIVVTAIASLNWFHYGVFATVEFKHRSFLRAYGSLSRIETGDRHRYVPVSRAARLRAYAASPTFRELRAPLEGRVGTVWARQGGRFKPSQEIAGGWFMWALRESACEALQCANGGQAMAFYARIASEIDAACDRGEVRCLPPRATMLPVLLAQDARRLAAMLSGRALPFLLGFESSPAQLASSSTLEQRRLFARVLPQDVPAQAQLRLGREARFGLLRGIGAIYQMAVGPWFWLATIAWSYLVVVSLMGRAPLDYRLVVATSLLVAIGARLSIVSLFEMTSAAGIRTDYLAAAYPLVLLYSAMVSGAALHHRRARRR